jgi:protein ImuB
MREGEPGPYGKVPIAEDPLLRPGTRPTRLLEEPRPLEVDLSPSGRIMAVRIGSRRHAAASVRGPERLCGEWWRAGFSRDYYRALVAGLGGCWIFRDAGSGRFFLHGYFD